MSFPKVAINARAATRVRRGFPWVYANDVADMALLKKQKPGAPVIVIDPAGVVLGIAGGNAHSLIALRLWAFGEDVPTLDAAWFAARLQEAAARRATFFTAPYYRLAHAEADGLPGIVIDRFGDTFVAQINTAAAETQSEALEAGLTQAFPGARLHLRRDAPSRAHEGLAVEEGAEDADADAAKSEPLRFEENGVTYFADLATGQKTGWYYDLRAARAAIAPLAKDRTAWDLCCHTGGFSLLMAKAGATQVTALDRSKDALALAHKAADANKLAQIDFVEDDIFDWLGKRADHGDKVDLIIADPPPFARSKKDVPAALRAYQRLAKLAAGRLTAKGHLFIASCSHNITGDAFTEAVAEGVAGARRRAVILARFEADADHPVLLNLPESAYLKGLLLEIE